MGFPGGKAGAGTYQKIINQIPPHELYIEPFLGSGAIMQRKRPARINFGLDIHAATAHATERRLRRLIPNLRVCNVDAFAWMRMFFGMDRVGPIRHCNSMLSAAAVEWSVIQAGFVYLDPPYLLSTRLSGSIYANELTMERHVELLDIAKRLPCMVAISGYWSPLYAAALATWRHIAFNVQTRGRKAREFVWFNYPAPTALHDYRYLGDNKRQRERIARKVRTWAAGLQRLPRLERQAILDRLSRDEAAGSAVA